MKEATKLMHSYSDYMFYERGYRKNIELLELGLRIADNNFKESEQNEREGVDRRLDEVIKRYMEQQTVGCGKLNKNAFISKND